MVNTHCPVCGNPLTDDNVSRYPGGEIIVGRESGEWCQTCHDEYTAIIENNLARQHRKQRQAK